MKPSFAIVGCGKVGTALAVQLKACRYSPVSVISKSTVSAQALARKLGLENAESSPGQIMAEADIVFITTPDGEIQGACSQIALENGFKKGAIVLHCSGALPSTILETARDRQAAIGSLHPLQSFATIDMAKSPFEGIVISVEGDPAAVETGKKIASDLKAICFVINTEAKTLYHAAAVVASNYLVTLQGFAFALLKEAGIASKDAYRVLAPLIQGTLANIEKVGIEKALTGPIVRGDAATVQKHLEAIQQQVPELEALYKMLGRYTVPIARASSSLREDAAEKLNRILS